MRRIFTVCALLLALALPARSGETTLYVACSAAQAVTAAADMLHVEAGIDKTVFVSRVWIVPGTQTAAGYHQIVLRRTTAASTGGATVTPSPVDGSGPAFTGIVRVGAAGGGTDGVTLVNSSYFVSTATTVGVVQPFVVFDGNGTLGKAIRVQKGGTTGIELRNLTGAAGGANHYACAQFSEER